MGFLLIATGSCLLLGIVIAGLLLTLPDLLVGLFLKEGAEGTLQLATAFIKGFWPAFVIMGANICISCYFTAMHKPVHSAVLALLRSFLLPAILVMLLPRYIGDYGIYIAIPIGELLTLLLGLVLFNANRPAKLMERSSL